MSDSTNYEEVARLRLPVLITSLETITTGLQMAYGKRLLICQEGEWLIVEKRGGDDEGR